MSRLHDFERMLDDKLRKLFRGTAPQGHKLELVEVHRAILDEVASRIESLPRGRRLFAYPRVTVKILLPDADRRSSYEAAFVENGALARDIAGRIADEHVDLPEKFRVEVDLVDELPESFASRGFEIEYQTEAAAKAAPAAAMPAIWLKVLTGTADKAEYSLRRARVNIGRLTDVIDSQQRLLRRNDIAFAETANPTVSRTHAHIEFQAGTGEFRLFDDRSAQGTTVLRDGNIIPVPKGPSKGVVLCPGDEIVVGQARLSFEIHSEADTR